MSNQERIIIFGRLGKNPELKYTRKQEPVCTFTVAENIQGREKPRWHNIVIWGKQAEQCSVYLKKGVPIFVRGQNKTTNYINRNQEKKQFTELRADSVAFIY